jgi:hypothetical protein
MTRLVRTGLVDSAGTTRTPMTEVGEPTAAKPMARPLAVPAEP